MEHHYGENIHIIDSVFSRSLLSEFGDPATTYPQLKTLLESCYDNLLQAVVEDQFPRVKEKRKTRMTESTGVYLQDCVIEKKAKVVIVSLIRAGIMPAERVFSQLHQVLPTEQIRQDHFSVARKYDEHNNITIDCSGSKIGGDIDESLVLFPDPMGATGESIKYCLNHYLSEVQGKAKKMITMHLVITPEYIRNIQASFPEVEVYALRVDRGLSCEKILSEIPGRLIDEEKGLNNDSYIVPGLGGVGEILTNSFV